MPKNYMRPTISTVFAFVLMIFTMAPISGFADESSIKESISRLRIQALSSRGGLARFQFNTELPGFAPSVEDITYDGKYLLVKYNATLSLFDLPIGVVFSMVTGMPVRYVEYTEQMRRNSKLRSYSVFYTFVPQTHELLIAGEATGELLRYDVQTGAILQDRIRLQIPQNSFDVDVDVETFQFSPDGKQALVNVSVGRPRKPMQLLCKTDALSHNRSGQPLPCENLDTHFFPQLLRGGTLFSVSLSDAKALSFLFENQQQQARSVAVSYSNPADLKDFKVAADGSSVVTTAQERVGDTLENMKFFDFLNLYSSAGKLIRTIRPYTLPEITSAIDSADEYHSSNDWLEISQAHLSYNGHTVWFEIQGANEWGSTEHAPKFRVEFDVKKGVMKRIDRFDPATDFASTRFQSMPKSWKASAPNCADSLASNGNLTNPYLDNPRR